MSFVPAEIKMDRCPLTQRFVWKQHPLHPRMESAVEEDKFLLITVYTTEPCVVGPCHHGMARPQVAERGTASDMESSCE